MHVGIGTTESIRGHEGSIGVISRTVMVGARTIAKRMNNFTSSCWVARHSVIIPQQYGNLNRIKGQWLCCAYSDTIVRYYGDGPWNNVEYCEEWEQRIGI